MSADISTIIIEELPTPGSAGTRLELRGGGLPKQGATWGGKHTVVTRWYAGNPVATQQAIGPQELPSNWEGVWHRNMLEDSPASWTDKNGVKISVTHPFVLMQLLDDIRFRGNALRVTWATTSKADGGTPGDNDLQIIREGRLSQCEFPIQRAEDIEWKATFDWYSRGDPAAQRTTLRATGFEDTAAALTIALQELLVQSLALKNRINPLSQYGGTGTFGLSDLDKLANYPKSLAEDITNQVNVYLARLQEITSAVQQAIVTPAEVADMALSLANSVLAYLNQTALNFSLIPYEYAAVSIGSGADVARNAKYLLGIQDEINASQDKVLQIIQQAAKQKASQSAIDPRGARIGDGVQDAIVYRVKKGDTAIALSTFYYQTPDYAGAILRANHLSPFTVTLDPGTILVIPTSPWGIK